MGADDRGPKILVGALILVVLIGTVLSGTLMGPGMMGPGMMWGYGAPGAPAVAGSWAWGLTIPAAAAIAWVSFLIIKLIVPEA